MPTRHRPQTTRMISDLVARFAKRARRIPRRYLVYYGSLLLIAVALCVFLDGAARPWDKGVEAREAAGLNVKVVHHAISGLYYGAWFSLAIVAQLAACGPLALRRLSPEYHRLDAGLGRRSAPLFLLFAIAAMTVAGVRMAPRLDSSLWGDEDYTVRRSVLGQYERKPDGELRFREATWTDTFFYYKNPNNHVLFSILARLSHSGYDPGDDPSKLHFDERRLRLPAYLAGILAVASVGYMLATAGYTRAGIAAMFLLALHPWLLRHGCEARGYPLALALGPLCITFLIKALRRGRPGYWAAFAASEFLVFYAYPGTIYLLIGINLAALLGILLLDLGRRDRLSITARWFTANTFAALPATFLVTPLLPQLKGYLERNAGSPPVGPSWVGDNLCYLASGMPWRPWHVGNPNDFHLSASPLGSSLMLGAVSCLAALGIYRLWRAGGTRRWLIVALTLPYLIMLLHAASKGMRVYHWYAVPMLPLSIALIALGIEFLPSRVRAPRPRTLFGFALLGAYLWLYTGFTGDVTGRLREQSVEPLRESVARTRPVLNPRSPSIDGVLTAQFCMGTLGYDPTTYLFKKDDPEGFRELMARADREGKPLFVNIGLPALARTAGGWPGIMAIVDDPSQFEALEPMWGLLNPCTRYLFRYLGAGGDGS